MRAGAAVISAAASLVTVAGCGVTHVNAPTITVVTSLYPLAQAVSTVGAAQVKVIDLTSPGVNPQTMTLSATQRHDIATASLVVDIGEGFQPSVEAAAKRARHVLALLPAIGGTNPYVWLDPYTMERVGTLIQAALTKVEPAAHTVFTDGEEDLAAEVQSLDIDYQNSLSDCPNTTFVTSNDAFARMDHRYDVVDHVVGTSPEPSAQAVKAAAAAITASGSTTVFKEPYVNSTMLGDAASVAGIKVRTLSTLETPPASGPPEAVSYSNLMEANLNSITGALQCSAMGQN